MRKISRNEQNQVRFFFRLIISRQLETGFVFFRVVREFLSVFLFSKTDFSPKVSKFLQVGVRFFRVIPFCFQPQSRISQIFSRYLSWLKC